MKQKKNRRRIINVPLNQIVTADQLQTPSNLATEWAELRLMLNLEATGHPFRHQTVSGVVVEPDPTLEHLLLMVPADDQQPLRARWELRIKSGALKAIPVDRLHYGFDPYHTD